MIEDKISLDCIVYIYTICICIYKICIFFSDEWMNLLTEKDFSVKLNYRVGKVFGPSDEDRIDYPIRGKFKTEA